ncbi:MAG TPA: glycosyltransferase family 4 protein [Candidatus Woesebacteria bacterium]|nr:glycosyltransferase family 4 protein [Candidatus Woesebacteria bacterium]
MKIAQISSYYPPHLGGGDNVVRSISEQLAKNGHQVEVFTSDIGTNSGKLNSSKNLKIHYLKAFEIAHSSIIYSIFFKLINIPKKAILHVHVGHIFVPEVVFLVSKLRNIPYIVHFHIDVDPSGPFGILLKPYKKIFLSTVLRGAAKVICLTGDQKEFLIKNYSINAQKIEIIPNGVGEEYFVTQKTKNRMPHLLFVGRLADQKNIPFMLESFSLIKTNAHFDIVGEGEKRKEIEDKIKKLDLKNVILHGHKSGNELIALYKQADLFIFASKNEGMSLSMLEAMAAGLPIIGNDTKSISDLINDCSITINNPTPQKYADAIDSLLINKKRLQELSRKSIEKAKQYTWKNTVKNIERIYKSILDNT